MRVSPFYKLDYIEGRPFLLPFGQNIAEYRKSIALNDLGVLLWQSLGQADSVAELVETAARHLKIEKNERTALQNDVTEFVRELQRQGALLPLPQESPVLCCFQIAGILLAWHGPGQLVHPYLQSFCCSCDTATSADIHVFLSTDRPPLDPDTTETLLVQSDIWISQTETDYLLRCPGHIVPQCTIAHNGARGTIYFAANTPLPDLQEALFHTLRHIFLIYAQQHQICALHSASILYRGRAWLFSGPSGRGKSTHTALWKEYAGAGGLNGDFNLIGFQQDGLIVYGSPWCGTSGEYTTEDVPLGGIIFLQQAPHDILQELSPSDKQLYILNRLLTPFWNQTLFGRNVLFAGQLAKRTTILQLRCTKKRSAMELMRKEIERIYP